MLAFANIFMVKVETEILNQSALKQLVWKRFIDDIFPSGTQPEKITQFSLTNTIKISSLQLKYSKQKLSSWTLLNAKAKDLRPSRCYMYTPAKHFSTPIFQPAIHPE